MNGSLRRTVTENVLEAKIESEIKDLVSPLVLRSAELQRIYEILFDVDQ